ncbi:ATP-binding cassette domain-containing protein [Inquilinus limosus]|uniref:ABC transporter ATP-binding protein n=1 Tax=Inquilinus limosus TaxID=171674 RepID=UPI003F13FBAD
MHKNPQAPPQAPDDGVVIRVRGLKTQFGSQVIHEGLDLDVRRGEVLGVVGGSGTGKSVLLKEIIGLIRPAAGSIEVLGVNMDEVGEAERRAVQRRWGVMFQDGALFSSMTVAENIQVPMKEYTRLSREMMDDLARVKIAMAGLACSAAVKHPSELSGGMRKRAALARALALDPEIIFLDEPTAGLDPIGAAAFDQLIAELQRSLRLTVFMVTHDLDSLVTICDRIAVLIDKKVLVDTYENLLKIDHPWIQEYFHGPRGRAAAAEHAALERAQTGAEG